MRAVKVKTVCIFFFVSAVLFLGISCKRQSLIPAADNARLAFLFFTDGTLEEEFSCEKYEYNLKVNDKAENVFVLAITENPKSKSHINLQGMTLPINAVPMKGIPQIEFDIIVTAPAGNTQSYKIKAKKANVFPPAPPIPPAPRMRI